MAEFSKFDARHYPTLSIQAGYAAWANSYEATVLDLMDLRLLERLRTLDWPGVSRMRWTWPAAPAASAPG